MQNQINDRAHYRIAYPKAARPVFVPLGEDRAFPVVDCCESGLRFKPDYVDPDAAAPGKDLRGRLRFHDGETLPVGGVVVRVQEGEVALHLRESSIPLKRILFEQIFLRKRYPFWPGPEMDLVPA